MDVLPGQAASSGQVAGWWEWVTDSCVFVTNLWGIIPSAGYSSLECFVFRSEPLAPRTRDGCASHQDSSGTCQPKVLLRSLGLNTFCRLRTSAGSAPRRLATSALVSDGRRQGWEEEQREGCLHRSERNQSRHILLHRALRGHLTSGRNKSPPIGTAGRSKGDGPFSLWKIITKRRGLLFSSFSKFSLILLSKGYFDFQKITFQNSFVLTICEESTESFHMP